MSSVGWLGYVLTGLFFAYAEGYRGFQCRFSPMVVRRALLLGEGQQPLLRQIFGPFYAMGFFHATKKRKTMSYVLMFLIFGVVAMVKRLPYPYRSVLDGGVIIGLLWGMLSILGIFAKSVQSGHAPAVDPCLPEQKV
eukprot:TRINITY_DN20531_c0_g1_i2.p1 TRINITY_DN20531_c0_g1~~TRINITY_DN20531_c0_g1_i2.p1  ORF type:complete len:137 (+),score=20.96 TRINITY_DN20531_c0_g1_i2:339-749(+)